MAREDAGRDVVTSGHLLRSPGHGGLGAPSEKEENENKT